MVVLVVSGGAADSVVLVELTEYGDGSSVTVIRLVMMSLNECCSRRRVEVIELTQTQLI